MPTSRPVMHLWQIVIGEVDRRFSDAISEFLQRTDTPFDRTYALLEICMRYAMITEPKLKNFEDEIAKAIQHTPAQSP